MIAARLSCMVKPAASRVLTGTDMEVEDLEGYPGLFGDGAYFEGST